MTAMKSPWILAFGVVAVVHLVLNGAEADPWDSISKCLLAPLLVAWVIEQKGPRLLAAALVFCFFGDLFLEFDDLFIVGMAAFALGHICFIRFFVSRGAIGQLKRKPWILAIYALAGVAMIAYGWSGLEDGLKPVVPIYAALLVGTGATSLATDVRAGIGGLLFLDLRRDHPAGRGGPHRQGLDRDGPRDHGHVHRRDLLPHHRHPQPREGHHRGRSGLRPDSPHGLLAGLPRRHALDDLPGRQPHLCRPCSR